MSRRTSPLFAFSLSLGLVLASASFAQADQSVSDLRKNSQNAWDSTKDGAAKAAADTKSDAHKAAHDTKAACSKEPTKLTTRRPNVSFLYLCTFRLGAIKAYCYTLFG